jgi:hypothetical protein
VLYLGESRDRKVFSFGRILFLRIGWCLQALLFPTTPTIATGFQVFYFFIFLISLDFFHFFFSFSIVLASEL